MQQVSTLLSCKYTVVLVSCNKYQHCYHVNTLLYVCHATSINTAIMYLHCCTGVMQQVSTLLSCNYTVVLVSCNKYPLCCHAFTLLNECHATSIHSAVMQLHYCTGVMQQVSTLLSCNYTVVLESCNYTLLYGCHVTTMLYWCHVTVMWCHVTVVRVSCNYTGVRVSCKLQQVSTLLSFSYTVT